MRLEHDGLTLWFGTSDAPAPSGTEASNRYLAITVAVQPIDASNRVELRYRRNGQEPEKTVPAEWIWNDIQGDVQYFRGSLPPFEPGDQVEYAATCYCSGRQVPASDHLRYQGTVQIEAPPAEAFVSAAVRPANGLRLAAEPPVAGTEEQRPKAARLAATHQLIEDYHYSRSPSIATDLQGRFAVIERREGDRVLSEFITVSGDGLHFLYFRWDPDSDSGWSHESVANEGQAFRSPKTIVRLLAFWENGRVIVYTGAETSEYLRFERSPSGAWGADDYFSDGRSLNLYRDQYGSHYEVYSGGDKTTVLLRITSLDSTGSRNYFSVEDSETYRGQQFKIAGGDQKSGMRIFRLEGSSVFYRSAQLREKRIQWSTPWEPVHIARAHPIASLHLLQAQPSQAFDFLELDTDGSLYYVAKWNSRYPSSTPLTGGANQPSAVAQYTLGSDHKGYYRIFALDKENQNLWLLRQTGIDRNAQPIFSSWVPLGGQYQVIQSPAAMTSYGELFTVNLDSEILHKRQDDGNKVWRETPIKVPVISTSEVPRPTATYTTELNFTTAANAPVAGSLIDIYVSRAADISVNGVTHHASALYPITLKTDIMGRLTLSTVADKLTTTALMVHARDFMADGEAIALNPALGTHKRLAGLDQSFAVTGTALRSQGLIAGELSAQDADTVATAIKYAAAMLVPTQPPAPPSAAKLRAWLAPGQALEDYAYVANLHQGYEHPVCGSQGWSLDFSAPEGIRFSLIEPGAEALAPDFSFKHFWGDVSHFVKHVIKDVKKIEVKVVGGVIQLTLEGVEGLEGLGTFIIDSVEKAGEALGIIFHKIAQAGSDFVDAMQKVIDWLRHLFAWKDIARTERVLYYYIDQTLCKLGGSVDDWRAVLNSKFDEFKATITSSFDRLEDTFGTKSFNDLVGSSQTMSEATTGQPLTWPSMRAAYASHAVQCNYAQTRIQRHFARGGKANLAWAPEGVPEDTITTFFAAIQRSFPQEVLENSYQKMVRWSKGITDVESFFAMSIRDVLEVFKDFVLLVLDGIQEILDALLKLTSETIAAFRKGMEAEPDIPVISWLLKKNTSSKSLSLLHLFSYALAVPVTILYKLVYGHGKEAPFPTDAEVDAIVSTPIPWPNVHSAQNVYGAEWNDNCGLQLSNKTLNIVAGISVFIYYLPDMTMDLQNIQGGESERYTATVALLAELLAWACGTPKDVICSDRRSEADELVLAFWGVSAAPVLSDMLVAYDKGLARFLKTKVGVWVGAWWDGIVGASLVGLGVAATVFMKKGSNYNDWAVAYSLLAPLTQVAKPLTQLANKFENAGPDGAVVAAGLVIAVGVLDLTDVATGVTLIGIGASSRAAERTAPPLPSYLSA